MCVNLCVCVTLCVCVCDCVCVCVSDQVAPYASRFLHIPGRRWLISSVPYWPKSSVSRIGHVIITWSPPTEKEGLAGRNAGLTNQLVPCSTPPTSGHKQMKYSSVVLVIAAVETVQTSDKLPLSVYVQ